MPKTNVKSAGAWKPAKSIWVKDAGTWKEVQNAYIKDAGTWKRVHALGAIYDLTVGSYIGPVYGYQDDTNNTYGALSPAFWNGIHIDQISFYQGDLYFAFQSGVENTWQALKIGNSRWYNRSEFVYNSGFYSTNSGGTIPNPFGTTVGVHLEVRIK